MVIAGVIHQLGMGTGVAVRAPHIVAEPSVRHRFPKDQSVGGEHGLAEHLGVLQLVFENIDCYTLETQPEKSEIFSAAGVALSEPWREESPAPASCVSGVFSRQGDSGGHPQITVTAVTAVNLTGGHAPGLPTHFDWRDDHALCDPALPEAQGRFRRGL